MDANIELPVVSRQADEVVATLATLVHETSGQADTWRRLARADQIRYLQGLFLTVASAVDTVAVGVKRKRTDMIEELAGTSLADLQRLDWSTIFANPYPAKLVVRLVVEDIKPVNTSDAIISSMIQKIHLLFKVKPVYGEQAYK